MSSGISSTQRIRMEILRRCQKCHYTTRNKSSMIQHMQTKHPTRNTVQKILKAQQNLEEIQSLRHEMNTPGSPFYKIPKHLIETHMSPFLTGKRKSLNKQAKNMRGIIRDIWNGKSTKGGRRTRRRRTLRLE